MLSEPSNSLSTQQQRHEFPYLPDYFVTNLGSEGETGEREMGKTRSREELDRLVGWSALKPDGRVRRLGASHKDKWREFS